MIRCVIKPSLRENACLTGIQSIDTISQYKTSMIVSDIPLKKHSFFVHIEEFHGGEDDLIYPVLEVDSRKIGNLSNGDIIDLYPITVPLANRVLIGVESAKSSGLPDGDWTETLQNLLQDRYFDLGEQIRIAIDFPVNGVNTVKILTGHIIGTEPDSPVHTGPKTKLYLHKIPSSTLQKVVKQKAEIDLKRISEFSQKSKDILTAQLAKIKSDPETKSIRTLDFFSFSEEKLNQLVVSVCEGYEKYSEKVNQDESSYTSSNIFIIKTNNTIEKIIEVLISGTKGKGQLILNVYSNSLDSSEELNNILFNNLKKMYENARSSQLQTLVCPYCGATFSIEPDFVDGFICDQCGEEIH